MMIAANQTDIIDDRRAFIQFELASKLELTRRKKQFETGSLSGRFYPAKGIMTNEIEFTTSKKKNRKNIPNGITHEEIESTSDIHKVNKQSDAQHKHQVVI